MHSPVEEEDWARFRYYAAFVRVIARPLDMDDSVQDRWQFPQGDDGDVVYASSIWTLLARFSHGQPLLPAIQYIEWDIWDPTHVDLLHVVSPTLQRLHLRFRNLV